ESIINALDGTDTNLLPYIPYILQDFWEIGSSPQDIIAMIKKYKTDYKELRVLDLGCGKGAVSVNIAKELGCKCLGIDALAAFIKTAKEKASKNRVTDLCKFELGDIREQVKKLTDYDVVILGAIGPVLGNFYKTLTALNSCLSTDGIILIDDGYIDDSNPFKYAGYQKRSEVIADIKKSSMQLLEESIAEISDHKEYDLEMVNLEKRCRELITKHPEQAFLFENYINKQHEEYNYLKNDIVSSLLVIKKKL
ncbi:MAG: class I SAM-dependent methyltransferase, partial [Candidatus Cloacimonetes bacterium]|nr:class I SAM-dependent methyltransferase [Candidatus Cloacimonadota bacterium]